MLTQEGCKVQGRLGNTSCLRKKKILIREREGDPKVIKFKFLSLERDGKPKYKRSDS